MPKTEAFSGDRSTTRWDDAWKDILSGGPTRWKIDDLAAKQQSLQHIQSCVTNSNTKFSILCPLAGDDMFVHYAWSQGHSVTSIDLVPEAVEQMRRQFGNDDDDDDRNDWQRQELMKGVREDGATQVSVIWKHKSGRATLYEGDVLQKRPDLEAKFDVIYDKDAFGALQLDMRQRYCQRLSDYLKDDGIVYSEVVMIENGNRLEGPPFHVEKDDLMVATNFGTDFVHLEALGEIYKTPTPEFTQTGHLLKRRPRQR